MNDARRIGWAVWVGLLVMAVPSATMAQGTSSASSASAGLPAVSGAGGTSSSGTAKQNKYALGKKLTLVQCFRASLAGSRDLLLARENLTKAALNIRQAWSAFKPNVSIGATLTRHDKAITFGTNTIQQLWQTGASGRVVQPLFNGQAIPTLSALHSLEDATRLENEQVRTDILYGVATAFYSAAALQESVQVAERQVKDTSDHLSATQARFKVGEVSKVDLLRAEIDKQTAEEDLIAAQAGLASAKIALATLIGRPPEAGDFELVRPVAPKVDDAEVEAAVKQAAKTRPDLAAADLRLTASEKMVTAAWLEFLPSLSVAWNGSYTQVTNPFQSGNFSWQAILTLSIPLYDGGQRYVDIQNAHIQERQAQLSRDGLSDQIRKEVLQARLDMKTASANLEKAKATEKLAAENADLVRARFAAGLATSLDVTDATTQRFQAGVDVIRQRLSLEVSMLSLARSMGMFDEVAGVPKNGG